MTFAFFTRNVEPNSKDPEGYRTFDTFQALENGCSPLLSGRPTTVGGSRKPRTDFSAEQRTVLEEVFRRTKHVEKEELLHLAQQLNVLEKSVRSLQDLDRSKVAPKLRSTLKLHH